MPLAFQIPFRSRAKTVPKKILKSSGQFASHKFKRQKGNQPHLWLVFII